MAHHPRTRGPRRLLTLSALVILVSVAVACGGDADSEDSSNTTVGVEPRDLEVQPGGKLVYGIDAESDGYNPQSKRFAQSGHTVASSVMDTLATWDENGDVVPYLAESIEPNDDFTVWTITLREGVTFHSGDPLTAESVAQVLEAARTGLVTSSSLVGVSGVEATGDLAVEVTMTDPWPHFPGILTTQAGYVFDPAMLTETDSASHPVGTGPFMFDTWDVGSSFTVIRNPDYWRTDEDGVQLPYLDEIEFRIISDAAARNEALRDGDVGLMFSLTPSSIIELRQMEAIQLAEYNLGDEDLVALQTDDIARPTGPDGEERVSPFNNIHARLALAYATDQEAFLTDVQQNVNVPATGPYSPGQLGFREDNGYPTYDPDRAREELALYTEDTGEETLRFTYTAADDVHNLAAAQYLVSAWAEVGIEAEIKSVAQADVIVNAVIGTYEAIDWRNFGAPDPDTDQLWFHSSSVRPLEEGISVNITHFADEAIDGNLDTGRESTDETARDEAYAAVASRFGETLPYLWLGRVGWAMAADPQVHGWEVATENGTVATVGSKTWLSELWIEQ
jgi:peptide/nickel transport system substrate-binding protein